MPLDVQPGHVADESRLAWVQFLLAGSVLVLLAALLPTPWSALALASQNRSLPNSPVGETAMMLVAAILVWGLLGWAVIAAGAALLSRIPGAIGRRGDRLLSVLAPAVARKVLLTVVGASMVTGLAACGTSPAAAASVQENGHLLVGPAAVAVASPGVTAVPSVTRVRSWAVVEGSTVHLPPDGSSSAVSLVLSVDPIGAGPERPAHRGEESATVDIDWPSAHADPDRHIDIDWPEPAATIQAAPRPPPKARPSSSRSSEEGVVVHRGDSLWSIAASHLPNDSSTAAIEKSWHHWYSANRSVIGADPNLLLPGQILQPPVPAPPPSTNG